MPTEVELDGRLDAQALDVALSELLRRHESLRTTIQVKAMQPLQIIAQARAFLAPVVDLQGLQAEHCEAQARNLAREVAARPFDLGEVRLLRESIRNRSILRRVGYLPVNPRFPMHLNAIQVLRLYGSLSGGDHNRIHDNAEH